MSSQGCQLLEPGTVLDSSGFPFLLPAFCLWLLRGWPRQAGQCAFPLSAS